MECPCKCEEPMNAMHHFRKQINPPENLYEIECFSCGHQWVGKDQLRVLVEEQGYKLLPWKEKKLPSEQLELELDYKKL